MRRSLRKSLGTKMTKADDAILQRPHWTPSQLVIIRQDGLVPLYEAIGRQEVEPTQMLLHARDTRTLSTLQERVDLYLTGGLRVYDHDASVQPLYPTDTLTWFPPDLKRRLTPISVQKHYTPGTIIPHCCPACLPSQECGESCKCRRREPSTNYMHRECTHSGCCDNNRIRRGIFPLVSMCQERLVDNDGTVTLECLGVKAMENIKRGSPVGPFSGVIQLDDEDGISPYAFRLPPNLFKAQDKSLNPHSDDYVIEGVPNAGPMSFVNDTGSKSEKINVEFLIVETCNQYTSVLFAKRDIQKYEHLGLSYGPDYFSDELKQLHAVDYALTAFEVLNNPSTNHLGYAPGRPRTSERKPATSIRRPDMALIHPRGKGRVKKIKNAGKGRRSIYSKEERVLEIRLQQKRGHTKSPKLKIGHRGRSKSPKGRLGRSKSPKLTVPLQKSNKFFSTYASQGCGLDKALGPLQRSALYHSQFHLVAAKVDTGRVENKVPKAIKSVVKASTPVMVTQEVLRKAFSKTLILHDPTCIPVDLFCNNLQEAVLGVNVKKIESITPPLLISALPSGLRTSLFNSLCNKDRALVWNRVGGINLTIMDALSLVPPDWLTDNVMMALLIRIVEQVNITRRPNQPKVVPVSIASLHLLLDGKRWDQNVVDDIVSDIREGGNADVLACLIHHNGHWTVVLISKGGIQLYDPLVSKTCTVGENYGLESLNNENLFLKKLVRLKNFGTRFFMVAEGEITGGQKNWPLTLTYTLDKSIPVQQDGYSCGPLTIAFLASKFRLHNFPSPGANRLLKRLEGGLYQLELLKQLAPRSFK